MTIFPTGYSPKATPDGTDVVWSSDAITNFNLTIASIALYTLTNSDTDSLSEGSTNLYYTEARVDTNTTVVGKADKTNVLELDNTTPFTPTLPYHPVTKDYTDTMTIPDATNTVKGKIRIATDPEIITGTDELTCINPKQAKDNYTIVSNTIIGTITFDDIAQSDVLIPHGLGKVPRSIIVDVDKDEDNLDRAGWASYDGTTITQKCYNTDGNNYTDNLFVYGGIGDVGDWAITSIDSTNITLSYTVAGTYGLVNMPYMMQVLG